MTADEARNARYLAKVDRRGPDECWPWTAATNRFGYGIFKGDVVDGKAEQLAHRYGYRLQVGPIGDGLCVCHHCDNPPCQNPSHWFLGTPADNAADKVAKGRHHWMVIADLPNYDRRWHSQPGTSNGATKLTEDDVLAILRLYGDGATQDELASRYGVGQPTIGRILRGERWAHVATDDLAPWRSEPRRRARGARNARAKLTIEQADEIRRIYGAGEASQQALADRYGVSQASVSSIILGRTHVRQ